MVADVDPVMTHTPMKKDKRWMSLHLTRIVLKFGRDHFFIIS